MKKKGVTFPYIRSSISLGILLSAFLLIFSLTSKYLSIFNGITSIFLDLFSEFGYDLNLFGILIGIISAFLFGFITNYIYNTIFWNLLKR